MSWSGARSESAMRPPKPGPMLAGLSHAGSGAACVLGAKAATAFRDRRVEGRASARLGKWRP
eukprot:8970852-Pyramimonas_sp.AAC.1